MSVPVRHPSGINRGAAGMCPDCGAEVALRRGRVDAHFQAIIRAGQVTTGELCRGEGEPPDVDVTGLDPVVADLVERRRAAGWTRREFAAAMGRDRETVTRMERGVSVPSLALLRDAVAALGVDLVVTR